MRKLSAQQSKFMGGIFDRTWHLLMRDNGDRLFGNFKPIVVIFLH